MDITDGAHVPVIPLFEVAGKDGTVAPSHTVIDVPKSNVGIVFGVTVTENVVGNAHTPAVGVNV